MSHFKDLPSQSGGLFLLLFLKLVTEIKKSLIILIKVLDERKVQ